MVVIEESRQSAESDLDQAKLILEIHQPLENGAPAWTVKVRSS